MLLDDMSALSEDYAPSEGSEWSADGKLEENSGEDAPRLMRENAANLESFMFSYQSPHDPAGLGANGNYLPNFYALALTRLGQDSGTGEWSYLALVIEPDRLYLAGWSADGQDTLGQPPAMVANTPGQWYDVHITFDGNLVSVQRGIYGGALQPLYTGVDVSAFSTHSDVSFGKGKAADYQFDDLRLQADTISALSASRRYEYDALGRRVLQTVLVDGVPVNTFFIYDGDRVIEEYRDQEGGAHQLQARYVYGQYIDEVLQRELDLNNNGSPEVVHYYLHDDLYNVVGVTDSSGALVERYEYGEYGKPSIFQVPASGPEVEISTSAIANRYMFNGREYDSGTGLYWYRTRYMDPEQGRFIARDTIGAWGDASNLGNPFAYVGNNPWSGLDPYGRSAMGSLLTGNSNATEEEFNAALGEFRQPMNRGMGLLMMSGSVPEFVGGFTLASGGGAASMTGVGAVPGIPALVAGSVVMTHAVDVGSTGWYMFRTGEACETQTYQAVLAATGSETAAMYVDMGLSMIGPAPAAARAGSGMLGEAAMDATGRVSFRAGTQVSKIGKGYGGNQIVDRVAEEIVGAVNQADRVLRAGGTGNTRWGAAYQRLNGTGHWLEPLARGNALQQIAELQLRTNRYVLEAGVRFNRGHLLGLRNSAKNLLRPDFQILQSNGKLAVLELTTQGQASKIFKYGVPGKPQQVPQLINVTYR